MLQKKSRKFFILFLLFLLIGSLNNKNLNEINFLKVNKIKVSGLDNKNNNEIMNKLDVLEMNNLFFLKEVKIKEILNSNSLIENYFVFKKYPSTLNIKIIKTQLLAKLKKKDNFLFIGSNGKLINSRDNIKDIPNVFGNFKIKDFFAIKKMIDESNFDYHKIQSLIFFESGRWDLITYSDILIKLPSDNINKSLKLVSKILTDDKFKKIKLIDLRQHNQIIINE